MSSFDKVYNSLVSIYDSKYPHNPGGVMRFHLSKIQSERKASIVEAFIRLAYDNGVKVDEVEELISSGKSFDEAVKIAASNLSWWDKLINEGLNLITKPSKSPEEIELEDLMKMYRGRLSDMILVTTPYIPGYKIVEIIGPVYGLTIRTRGLGGKLAASIESLFGGEITAFVYEFEKARIEALLRLIDRAKKLGANAIIGLDFETTDILAGSAMAFSVYGTAVKIVKES
ncbi:MAG: heavy metal-binding domain-containing protein [Candidatus Methanomethylicia archaeon]